MSEEEILQELNDHLPYDYCRSEGTEDGTYQEWIDEDSWQFQLKLLVENKNKEIERLNYIIDEIEQYCLDEQVPEEYPDYNSLTEIFNSIYDTIYNKIKKLKEEENNG